VPKVPQFYTLIVMDKRQQTCLIGIACLGDRSQLVIGTYDFVTVDIEVCQMCATLLVPRKTEAMNRHDHVTTPSTSAIYIVTNVAFASILDAGMSPWW